MCGPNYVGPTGIEGCVGISCDEEFVKVDMDTPIEFIPVNINIPDLLKEAYNFYDSRLNIPKSVQRREKLMKGDENGIKEE